MECPIASFLDIIAMKIIAIVQRGSAKDFIDLFFLLKKIKLQFHEIVGLVKKKYGVEDRYEYQIKTAITYFDDADQEVSDIYLIDKKDNLEMISEKNWNDIKHFFIEFAGWEKSYSGIDKKYLQRLKLKGQLILADLILLIM